MLLLHLSDIHIRDGEAGTALDPNAHLRNELLLDAEQQCARIGQKPDAVLITGDLTYAAARREFDYAVDWLGELCQRCQAPLSSVFVVPGNHDVVRSVGGRRAIQAIHHQIKQSDELIVDPLIAELLRDEETSRMLYESLAPYNSFASQFFCDLLPPERTTATRDLKLNDGSILRLSGFNSTFVSSAADVKGDLFVDPSCFQLLRNPGVVHLAMCHHPFNWLRQGQLLNDFLNDNAHLQLFGHDHSNRIDIAQDYVRIYASAAHPDRTEHGWEPGYNLIELHVEGNGVERNLVVRAHVRVWQKTPGEFRAKTKGGRDTFDQSIQLDPWLAPPVASSDVHLAAAVTMSTTSMADTQYLTVRTDVMQTLREISVRFFKLTLSQKASIAGQLGLLEEEDVNQPDFERFRRAFLRARDRGLVEQLDQAVLQAEEAKS